MKMDLMKYKTKREILFYVMLTLVGFLAGYLYKNNVWKKFQVNITDSSTSYGKSISTPEIFMPSSPGLENNFTLTIRSCLGPECYDSRPTKSTTDRVGILALPGSGVQALLAVLRKSARKTPLKFDLELDTHVPAYGYGKNHGWNRIVRVARNLIPHAYSLMKHMYPINQNGSTSIPAAAFETQIRQLTRWHCRLSHVAAHTKMLTIFLEDVYQKPVVELERMITFIGVPMLRPELLAAVREMDLQSFRRDDVEVPDHLRAAGLRALHDELMTTHGLTDWPCKSFKELEGAGHRLQLHTRDLAANCSSPFVKCTVGFDLKEQA